MQAISVTIPGFSIAGPGFQAVPTGACNLRRKAAPMLQQEALSCRVQRPDGHWSEAQITCGEQRYSVLDPQSVLNVRAESTFQRDGNWHLVLHQLKCAVLWPAGYGLNSSPDPLKRRFELIGENGEFITMRGPFAGIPKISELMVEGQRYRTGDAIATRPWLEVSYACPQDGGGYKAGESLHQVISVIPMQCHQNCLLIVGQSRPADIENLRRDILDMANSVRFE